MAIQKGKQLPPGGFPDISGISVGQNPGMMLNMAMLSAAQGNCDCDTCKLLRKVNQLMVKEALKEE